MSPSELLLDDALLGSWAATSRLISDICSPQISGTAKSKLNFPIAARSGRSALLPS
jgi:hypothetical protein